MPLDAAKIRERRLGNRIDFYPSIGSTMVEASRLASGGAPHGTVVLADEQTAGVGRLGRAWHSEAETGIYCSILLQLGLPPSEVPIATLLLGLATGSAIETVTNLRCDLRWPNDVLIDGNKVAGILAQLVGDYVIAGIGINVNQTELPKGLRTPATSLRLAAGGKELQREDLVIQLLDSIDSFISVLREGGRAAILRTFSAASSYVLNRRVILEDSGRRGVTAGLDDHGFLMVRYESGELERVASGGVRADV